MSKEKELFWRITSSSQRKDDVKLATQKEALVKIVAGALNELTEIYLL